MQTQTIIAPTTLIAIAPNARHAPRTGYNLAMWQAIAAVPNIAQGVTFANLHAALMAAVPGQAPHHCTAHVKYLLRQKGALITVAPSKGSK